MELIDVNLIDPASAARSKEEAIQQVAAMLEQAGRLSDKSRYISDVYEREKEFSTALGFSFAIPHAKSAGVNVSSLVFLHLKDEVMWDDEPVRYVFGIAAPAEQEGNEHLKVLSRIARKIIHEEFLNGLQSAESKEDYLRLILQD